MDIFKGMDARFEAEFAKKSDKVQFENSGNSFSPYHINEDQLTNKVTDIVRKLGFINEDDKFKKKWMQNGRVSDICFGSDSYPNLLLYLEMQMEHLIIYKKDVADSRKQKLIPSELSDLIAAYVIAKRLGSRDIEKYGKDDLIARQSIESAVFLDVLNHTSDNRFLDELLASNLIYQNIKGYEIFVETFSKQLSAIITFLGKCKLEHQVDAMTHIVEQMRALLEYLEVNFANSRYEEHENSTGEKKTPGSSFNRSNCNIDFLIRDIRDDMYIRRLEWLPKRRNNTSEIPKTEQDYFSCLYDKELSAEHKTRAQEFQKKCSKLKWSYMDCSKNEQSMANVFFKLFFREICLEVCILI